MTHPSYTALEALARRMYASAPMILCGKEYSYEEFTRFEPKAVERLFAYAGVVATYVAALEAELVTQRRVGVHEICSMCGLDLRKATTECPTWHGLDHLGCDYAKKAEAQLATRLPTKAQISYLLEVLAKEGVTNGGGDFMRRKISKAILALLSGVVTPAPTAALTEEDFREVMKALEDLSFECFSPIAPCNPPSVATYNRTFEVLNKHRAARGWKVVPKSTPQGAEE